MLKGRSSGSDRAIAIAAGLPTPITVRLSEPDGWSEHRLDRGDPRAARTLAEGVARGVDGRPIELASWPVTAFDRLLVEIYEMLYGPLAECRVACRACERAFEFAIVPRDVAARQDAASAQLPPPDPSGFWSVDGFEVRAPCLRDLEEVAGSELIDRLVRGPSPDRGEADVFLETAAPVMTFDLDAACPECGEAQPVRFDLAAYLVAALSHERPFLIRETHLLASCYGWTLTEIMSLSRGDRRAYADLVERDRAATGRPRPRA